MDISQEAILILRDLVQVLEYQEPNIANQGLALDAFSALAHYNSIAKQARDYLGNL